MGMKPQGKAVAAFNSTGKEEVHHVEISGVELGAIKHDVTALTCAIVSAQGLNEDEAFKVWDRVFSFFIERRQSNG